VFTYKKRLSQKLNILPHFNVLQIARAAVVFNVDEIIVFDEDGSTEKQACFY